MARGSDQDVAAIMAEQLAGAQPEPPPVPAWRPSSRKHYFRTDPGHRIYLHRIPGVLDFYDQDNGREDGKTPTRDFFLRKYEKKYSEAERDRHAAARAANGGEWFIRFQHIPNKFEAYLETDSDELADYIRAEIAAGTMPHVYEDARVPAGVAPTMPPHRAVAAMRLARAQDAAST